jgi:hypothetical protein
MWSSGVLFPYMAVEVPNIACVNNYYYGYGTNGLEKYVYLNGFNLPFGSQKYSGLYINADNAYVSFGTSCTFGVDVNFNNYPCNGVGVWSVPNYSFSTYYEYDYYDYGASTCYSIHSSSSDNNADVTILREAANRVSSSWSPTFAVVVTWINATRNNGAQQFITVQLVLASDGNVTYAFLNYPINLIGWTSLYTNEVIAAGFRVDDPHNYNIAKWLFEYKMQYQCSQNMYPNGYGCNYINTTVGLDPFTVDKQIGNTGVLITIRWAIRLIEQCNLYVQYVSQLRKCLSI